MKRLAFSDDMMRAIAANQKSMTRRPEKRAVPDAKGRMFWKFHTEDPNGFPAPSIRWDGDIAVFRPRHSVGDLVAATCAYLPAKDLETGTAYRFNNPDFTDIGWKSSRIMPAALAPFALRITEVKAERLGQISEADAEREGITRREWMTERSHPGKKFPRSGWSWCWHRLGEASQFNTGVIEEDDICLGSARLAYANLWDHIYGQGAWERDSEAWMWCLNFEIAERRI